VGVGDDDGSFAELQHHAACAAPDDARPSSYGDLSTSSADRDTSATPYYAQAAAAGAAAAGVGPGSAATAAAAAAGGMLDRETALLLYREGPGATRASVLNDNHSRLKAAKRRRQLLAEQLNGLKAQVGGSKAASLAQLLSSCDPDAVHATCLPYRAKL
jgi:hypothetical protein